MMKTPMESWVGRKVIGPQGDLTPELLERYQVEKLRDLVAYVKVQSPFYRDLLRDVEPSGISDRAAFARLPFTTPSDVVEEGMRLLCTSQDEIERVVTLQTSGTTGASKRLFFTAADLEATVDFFHHGMSTMVGPGETVLIFLPGDRPDSVGDLLARGLARLGVKAVLCGPVRDPAAARAEILRHEAPCLVGIPTQILSLARGFGGGAVPRGWVKSVLLSTDYVPTAIEAELARVWGCRVFTHYGMTETGLGGGVECEAGEGYHLREADLFTEIIDPETGAPVEDGAPGEVVFTALTRQGMPLVRYRTGDLARFLTEPCPCGTVLRRLGRVEGRIAARVKLRHGVSIGMPTLDETLFPIAGVLNFTAKITESEGQDQLHLTLQVCEGTEERIARDVVAALVRSERVAPLFRNRALAVGSITFDSAGWFTTGTGKRQIEDCREQGGKAPAAGLARSQPQSAPLSPLPFKGRAGVRMGFG